MDWSYEISGGAKLVGDEPSKLTMGVTLWIDWILSLDLIVLNFLSYNLLFFGVVVVIVLQFLSTPYGRYARGGWGAGVNARVAWFVQEIPAFVVPLLLVYFTECPKLEFTPNKILLGLYLFHYFQRWVCTVTSYTVCLHMERHLEQNQEFYNYC